MTPVLLGPVTLAVNVWFCDGCKETEDGVSEIDTGGFRVIVAVPALEVSATLVAVTVTVWERAIEAGAVYTPLLEMVPTVGTNDHVTAVLALPATVAVNCWVCEAASEVAEGVTETATGVRLTVALADFVESAELFAVTVICC